MELEQKMERSIQRCEYRI